MINAKEITYNGNKYVFHLIEDADDILYNRHVRGHVSEMYIRFGLSRDFLKGIAKLLKQESRAAKNIDDLQDVCAKVAFNIEERLGLVAETKQYEELACIYTRLEIDGEMEPADYIDSWQEKKREIWQLNPDIKDFFLSKALQRSHGLASMSENDILHALKIAEARISQLPTLINSLQIT